MGSAMSPPEHVRVLSQVGGAPSPLPHPSRPTLWGAPCPLPSTCTYSRRWVVLPLPSRTLHGPPYGERHVPSRARARTLAGGWCSLSPPAPFTAHPMGSAMSPPEHVHVLSQVGGAPS